MVVQQIKMPFGQIILGPPASGKTTYCHGISQALSQLHRKPILVNLDPANDHLPYKPDIDLSDLITLDDIMNEFGLGPNGAMLYCMEYLEKNMDWLLDALTVLANATYPLSDEAKEDLPHQNANHEKQIFAEPYFLFDFPGQVELYTHHDSVKNIIDQLVKRDYRLCSVHLIDSHHCTDAGKYISMVLLSLKCMMQLGLPHINVLSKIDLVEAYGKLGIFLNE